MEAEQELSKPTKCPHCGGDLAFELVSRLTKESRMSFAVHPQDGELLSAKTVGGTLAQLDKLLTAIGKDLGVKTTVLVNGVSFDKGSVTVDLLVARHEQKPKAE